MTEPPANSPDDELLARLLRAIGPTPTLPSEMQRGWEMRFGAELSRHLRRKRRNRWLAAAAAVAMIGTTVVLHRTPTVPLGVTADVAWVTKRIGDAVVSDGAVRRELAVDEPIRSGAVVDVGPQSSLAFRYGDEDVRLRANTSLRMRPAGVQLIHGEVYVDAGPSPHRTRALAIETPRGTVTHVGTQYLVSVSDRQVVAALREGRIEFDAAGARRSIDVRDGPIELVVSDAGVATRSVSGTGARWAWTVDAAPGFVVDGRSADAFLTWAARQTGARLIYANDATRVHAANVLLHGGVDAVTVEQGMQIVAATTGLEIDDHDPSSVRVGSPRRPL